MAKYDQNLRHNVIRILGKDGLTSLFHVKMYIVLLYLALKIIRFPGFWPVIHIEYNFVLFYSSGKLIGFDPQRPNQPTSYHIDQIINVLLDLRDKIAN